jgi:putative transposase
MDDKERRAVALWRVGVLGPLVSARLDHGDRKAYFAQAAARTHKRPDGRVVELSARTIEAWFYAHQKGGFEALLPRSRKDIDQSRAIRPEVADLLVRAKREKPRRSIRRIIRLLERAGVVRSKELSRSSVHRLLLAAGVSARPVRGPSAERRSFLHQHASDLWVGDALHGPVCLAPDGSLRKAYLLSQIDGATRYVLHSYFAWSEGAVAQEHGLKQAMRKHGVCRMYYVDLGPAYVAQSLVALCAELEIHLLHTEAGDPEAKGVIERWHRTFREEVEDELPQEPVTLAELNAVLWAWLAEEYHARKHETTGRAPREHWLAEVGHLRPIPRSKDLEQVFLHRVERKVRKDGTVRWKGGYLEVLAELEGKTVELRFDPADEEARPRVFVRDAFVCDTVPLDRFKNAYRTRRRPLGAPAPDVVPTGLDPLEQMKKAHYERTRPVGARTTPPFLDATYHDDEEDD